MRETLQGARGSQHHLEQNRVATRAWFENHFPELVLFLGRFVLNRLLRASQTARQSLAVHDLAALLRRCPLESFSLRRRYVRSAPVWLSKPAPEWRDVPQPSSVCIPIAQRVAPIPPSAQWHSPWPHLLASV